MVPPLLAAQKPAISKPFNARGYGQFSDSSRGRFEETGDDGAFQPLDSNLLHRFSFTNPDHRDSIKSLFMIMLTGRGNVKGIIKIVCE
ncbi:hypothetical protein [Lederbergia citrea]|uniref:Uncharacterized protein n=1 Tax=Lederbergia citrea TaxID=2833581 RepID=A0A942Z3A7_9BACI|nr:hypothetical protein [Lederbergia citrea]MBS4176423.1 hypothetical protein [Lederbergia citrea]MBS4202984.1 hypothetical protein [Lederbergia citrea]MBS4222344.1 hypothetical protein [Lederbergia citrea]